MLTISLSSLINQYGQVSLGINCGFFIVKRKKSKKKKKKKKKKKNFCILSTTLFTPHSSECTARIQFISKYIPQK